MFWTIISSVFTSLITTRFTYHGDTLKELRKSREELYREVFKNIERLINNPDLVFQDEFIDSLVESKYKVKLIASERVINEYEKLYNFCTEHKKEYDCTHTRNSFSKKEVGEMIKNLLTEMRYAMGNRDKLNRLCRKICKVFNRIFE